MLVFGREKTSPIKNSIETLHDELPDHYEPVADDEIRMRSTGTRKFAICEGITFRHGVMSWKPGTRQRNEKMRTTRTKKNAEFLAPCRIRNLRIDMHGSLSAPEW